MLYRHSVGCKNIFDYTVGILWVFATLQGVKNLFENQKIQIDRFHRMHPDILKGGNAPQDAYGIIKYILTPYRVGWL